MFRTASGEFQDDTCGSKFNLAGAFCEYDN